MERTQGPPPGELRTLLFGSPISDRAEADPAETTEVLDACLRGAIDVLEAQVGRCDALEQARLEWDRVVAMPADGPGIAAKRAALLYALHREPALRAHFAPSDPDLISDLTDRVLPLTIPSFIAGMAQRPDALVALVATLCELWPGEALGTDVQADEEEEGDAHMEEAVGSLGD